MRSRKSIFVPIFVILTGVLAEMYALGVFGNALPGGTLVKLWPLLGAAAALDLLFVQRRLVGSAVMFFFTAALVSTQFLDAGWNNPIWDLFMKVWPILLILFGVDSIFAGRSLINSAVIIAGIVILAYVALAVLDVPFLKQLPVDLTSLLPTAVNTYPVQNQPIASQQNPASGVADFQQSAASPITTGSGGQIMIAMPSQASAALNLNAASGKVSIKADSTAGRFLGGTIQLDSGESLSSDASLDGTSASYLLGSSGRTGTSSSSNWDLALTTQRSLALNLILNSGYIKADLRSLNLRDVTLSNAYGPIDVMMPQSSTAKIRITAGNGDIRIYIPKNASINCTVTGTENVEYPQMSYTYTNNIVAPRRMVSTPVTVEVTSNGGSVRIIESE